jgi:hypothetical protein
MRLISIPVCFNFPFSAFTIDEQRREYKWNLSGIEKISRGNKLNTLELQLISAERKRQQCVRNPIFLYHRLYRRSGDK